MKYHNKLLVVVLLSFFLLSSCPRLDTSLAANTNLPLQSLNTTSLHLAVLGDAGSGTADQIAVAARLFAVHTSDSVQGVLYLGDNFYETGVTDVNDPLWNSRFRNIYDPALNIPFLAVLGNHDYVGNRNAQVLYKDPDGRWTMPYYFYKQVFEIQGGIRISVYCLDTNLILNNDQLANQQYQWLSHELSLDTSTWKIAIGHHPLVSNGSHGDTNLLRQNLEPLLRQGGVQVYLAGHDHDIEIFKPDNGLLNIVSGSAGKTRPITLNPAESDFASLAFGFVSLHISATKLIVDVHLADSSDPFSTEFNL